MVYFVALKMMKRSDTTKRIAGTTTFAAEKSNDLYHKPAHDSEVSIEKIVDKRWGKQPVQSKILIKRNLQKDYYTQDPDEDFDDK